MAIRIHNTKLLAPLLATAAAINLPRITPAERKALVAKIEEKEKDRGTT